MRTSRLPPRRAAQRGLLPRLAWVVTTGLALCGAGGLPAAEPLPAASPTPAVGISAAIPAEVAARAANPDELFQYIKEWDSEPVDAAKLAAAGDQTKAFFRAFMEDKVLHLQPAIDTFLARYPDDPRRWEVKLSRLWFLDTAEHIPEQEYADTYRQIVAAPEASHRAKQRARYLLLRQLLSPPDVTPADFRRSDDAMRAFEQDFPEDDRGAELVTERVERLGAADPARIVPVLQSLVTSPNAATAQAAQDQLALRTQPLDLRFTALDGTPVDLAKLRGKVVLLDFWATWCGPCMAKIPEVLALHRKYADRGLQVLGISLDEDPDAARKVAASKAMAWPQDCEGKGWQSGIARHFGVDEIPKVWLVDRRGMAHPLDAEKDDLDSRVAALLAEP